MVPVDQHVRRYLSVMSACFMCMFGSRLWPLCGVCYALRVLRYFWRQAYSEKGCHKLPSNISTVSFNTHAAPALTWRPVYMCPSPLQASPPFDFYNMPAGDRSKWLDDGLHMTELAYDTIGEMVAAEISKRTCAIPTTSNSS